MKKLTRILAAVLTLALGLSLTACHPKDEVAVTVDGTQYTSAMYMYALLQADGEAKNKVMESITDATSTTSIDYYSHTVEDKDFVTWVKDRAIEILKEFTLYENKCEELGAQPTDEEKSNLDMQTSFYWDYQGYSTVYEANGVSFDTYQKASSYALLSNTYFLKLYGAGGEKEVASSEIQKTLTDEFVLANVLTASFDSDMTDSEKESLRTKFDTYLEQLQKGSSFADIYAAYNGTSEESPDENETESTEDQPKDKYATVLGSEETAYADDNFEEIKGMAVGDMKIIELEDDAGLKLVVRQDISADPYYLEQLTPTILWMLKEDEFNDSVKSEIETMTVEVNDYAVDRFKVKKLKYPSAS